MSVLAIASAGALLSGWAAGRRVIYPHLDAGAQLLLSTGLFAAFVVMASGVLTVCPYCLSPYLPAPRGHSSLRTGAPELTKPDGRRGTQASSMASRDDA